MASDRGRDARISRQFGDFCTWTRTAAWIAGSFASSLPAFASSSAWVVELSEPGRAAEVRAGLEAHLGQDSVTRWEAFLLDARRVKVSLEVPTGPLPERWFESVAGISRAELDLAARKVGQPDKLRFGRTESRSAEAVPPSDPLLRHQWALKTMQVPEVWESGLTDIRRTPIAILSTGVQWTHKELLRSVLANPGEAGALSHNGIDDDGNGLVDDYRGWNFVDGNPDTLDRVGNGTWIAGAIGAAGNNGAGSTGMAWRASLLPVKCLNDSGKGTLSSLLQGIAYARTHGARIILLDALLDSPSRLLEEAISETIASGVAVIVSAGEEGKSLVGVPLYPASFKIPGMITVAMSDSSDRLSSLSGFGASVVHLASPGVGVLVPGLAGTYPSESSGSIASAHVAALSAMLLERNPAWTPAELLSRMELSSHRLRSMEAMVRSSGVINAIDALNGVVRPAPPSEDQWETLPYLLESPHPYRNDLAESYVVRVPGAKYLRVVFKTIDTERGCDFVSTWEPGGTDSLESLAGNYENLVSQYVQGEELEIRFTSDGSVVDYGFLIEQVQVIR